MTTRTLELAMRSSMDDALADGGVWFDWESGVAEPAPPLFLGNELEPRLLEPHRNRASYPKAGLACVRSAIVLDEAFLADESGNFYLSDLLFPTYVNGWIERGERPKQHRLMAELQGIDLAGVSVLAHNWNAGVYGHWLVEGLPKLLYLRTLPINPSRFIVESTVQPHVVQWIKRIFPEIEIETYDPVSQYVRCETLITPTMTCSPRYVFHPTLLPLFQSLAAARRPEKLLYLDRPWRGRFHWMENDEEVQDVARSFGFEVFSPIEHTIEQQIETFACARVIAGDYGSALHNSILSPPETRVLCFNWVTFIQSRIAQLCGQAIGFQLGRTGAPLTFEGYTVDLDDAKRAFEAALENGARE